MADEQNKIDEHELEQKIEQRLMPYRFWLFAAVSAFLVVTFVYYLPLRFQHQSEAMDADEHMMTEGMMQGEHGGSAYHEESEVREGLAVNMNATPAPVAAGAATRLDFFVNEKPANIPVPISDLELEHTKLMHVIGVRDDLNEFFHIHPEPSGVPGLFSLSHTFAASGRYKIWSEVKKDGVSHAFGHPEIEVAGLGTPSQKEVSFGRSAIVGNYQVLLDYDEPIAKGRETDLVFDIHDVFGREVEVEPYLAAAMHLSIIKDDLKTFIHTHPEGKGDGHAYVPAFVREALAHGIDKEPAPGEDQKIVFHAVFPEAGLYKLFAQFRPRGANLPPDDAAQTRQSFAADEGALATEDALLTSFWVRVEERAPSAVSEWWRNLLISAGAIVALSFTAKKFLAGKTPAQTS